MATMCWVVLLLCSAIMAQKPSAPEDCVVSSWSEWGSCSQACGGGVMERTRSIVSLATNGGASCPTLGEQRECNTYACAVDCVVSAWSAWSTCSKSCGGGYAARTRSMVTAPRSGGMPCPALVDERSCNTAPCSGSDNYAIKSEPVVDASNDKMTIVDCIVSEWSDWSPCSKSCGGGVVSRTRSIVTAPQGRGAAGCPDLQQLSSCNTAPCSTVKSVPLVDTKQSIDQVAVDCVVSAWSAWSTCSKLCGGGYEMRTRLVLTAPGNGGSPCPTLAAKRSCNTAPCDSKDKAVQFDTTDKDTAPVDCVVSSWSKWGVCSQSCGGGVMERTRSVMSFAARGGASCPTLVETQVCNTEPCSVDCVVTAWSAWGACSKSCGGGYAARTRSIVAAPQNGGVECPSMAEKRSCNTAPCSNSADKAVLTKKNDKDIAPVDCIVSSWSAWGSCSQACGGGVMQRSRSIVSFAANGGSSCPTLVQSQVCNTDACAVDCAVSAWSAWGTCSKSCGGGYVTRTRSIVTAPRSGGMECPSLAEKRSCNAAPCSVDKKDQSYTASTVLHAKLTGTVDTVNYASFRSHVSHMLDVPEESVRILKVHSSEDDETVVVDYQLLKYNSDIQKQLANPVVANELNLVSADNESSSPMVAISAALSAAVVVVAVAVVVVRRRAARHNEEMVNQGELELLSY